MHHKEKCYEENNEIATKKALCKKFNLSTKNLSVCSQLLLCMYIVLVILNTHANFDSNSFSLFTKLVKIRSRLLLWYHFVCNFFKSRIKPKKCWRR